jgi:hypothetical protein
MGIGKTSADLVKERCQTVWWKSILRQVMRGGPQFKNQRKKLKGMMFQGRERHG